MTYTTDKRDTQNASDPLAKALHRSYENEIRWLTPQADALFTTTGVYSSLEQTALAHKAYFERAASPLNKALRAAQNEGAHIGIAAAVGGLLGLIEGLARRDIINGVKRGIKYGAALGAGCRGFKHAVNAIGPRVYPGFEAEIGDLFASDSDFVQDPYRFLSRFKSIDEAAAKDPTHLGRLYTIFGIESKGALGSGLSYADEKTVTQLTGVGYAAMALIVNNIIRGDYLDPEQATGLGVLTGLAKLGAKAKYQEQFSQQARTSVEPTISGMDDHTRRQLVAGLIVRWYGRPVEDEIHKHPFRDTQPRSGRRRFRRC